MKTEFNVLSWMIIELHNKKDGKEKIAEDQQLF